MREERLLSRRMKAVLAIMRRREATGLPYVTVTSIMGILWPGFDRHVDYGEFMRRYQRTRHTMIVLERRGLVRRVAKLEKRQIGWATGDDEDPV